MLHFGTYWCYHQGAFFDLEKAVEIKLYYQIMVKVYHGHLLLKKLYHEFIFEKTTLQGWNSGASDKASAMLMLA